MAFISKDKKRLEFSINNDLGPGSYNYSDSQSYKVNNYPFNNSQTRDLSFSPKNCNPGVGTYILDQSKINDISNDNGSSFFKSKIDRFYEKEQDNNDILQYQNNNLFQQLQIKKRLEHQVQNQQSISSIPNLIIKNDDYIKYQKSLISEYFNDQKDSKQQCSFLQKQPKFYNNMKNQTNEDIGPGSYSTDISQKQFYQKNPNSIFSSKSQRNLFQKNENIKNQIFLKRLKSQASFLAQNQDELNQIQSFSNIDNLFMQNPGPGYYEQDKTQKQERTNLQNFGSSERRFEPILPVQNLTKNCDNNLTLQTVKQSFNKSSNNIPISQRFDYKQNQNPGPTDYTNKNTIQNKVFGQKKNQYIYKQKMEKFIEDTPGPGHYKNSEENIKSKQNFIFKSQSKKLDYIPEKIQTQVGQYYNDDQFKNNGKQYSMSKKQDIQIQEPKQIQDQYEVESIIHSKLTNKFKVVNSNFTRAKREVCDKQIQNQQQINYLQKNVNPLIKNSFNATYGQI